MMSISCLTIPLTPPPRIILWKPVGAGITVTSHRKGEFDKFNNK
jgi:hypothetical protein